MGLDWVDLLILGVIVLSVFTGFIRGFLKELIALSVWILAIWLAFKQSYHLDSWLKNYIQDHTARTVIAFIVILISVLIIGGIINAILSFFIKRSGLSGPDRILGMVFGFIRGVFIVALLMMAVQMTSIPYKEYAARSKLYTQFVPMVHWLYGFMPQFIKQMNQFDKQVGQELKENSYRSSKSDQKKANENMKLKNKDGFLIHPDDYKFSDD